MRTRDKEELRRGTKRHERIKALRRAYKPEPTPQELAWAKMRGDVPERPDFSDHLRLRKAG